MEYVKKQKLIYYLQQCERYESIAATGSIRGMKKLYGWNKAYKIFKSGKYYYALF